MDVGGPSCDLLLSWKLERVIGLGEIIAQRIEPDVKGLAFVTWHWDPPFDAIGWSRDGKVIQSGFHLLNNIGRPSCWDNEARILTIVLE